MPAESMEHSKIKDRRSSRPQHLRNRRKNTWRNLGRQATEVKWTQRELQLNQEQRSKGAVNMTGSCVSVPSQCVLWHGYKPNGHSSKRRRWMDESTSYGATLEIFFSRWEFPCTQEMGFLLRKKLSLWEIFFSTMTTAFRVVLTRLKR